VSTWLLFLIPSFIWGTTWLTIKFQLGVVAPEVSVVYRFALASAILFGWCAVRRVSLRFPLRHHASFAALGGLTYGLNYVLVYSSEKHLTSGLIAVIYVLIVFWNLLGARMLFAYRVPALVAAGALVGMVGVMLVFWPEVARVRAAPEALAGVTLAVAGSMAASAGNLYSQRVYTGGTAVAPSTAWAMGYAAIGVAGYCWLSGIPFVADGSIRYLASLAYLAIFGSVIAFITYLTMLRRIGAGRAGYTAVVIPVLAMVSSTLFEGYRWSLPALVGMVLVGVGNVLVMRGQHRSV
jgi:drug/metabolite transporter (DMT)-like permease